MSTTSSSPAPFILFAEKLDRNSDRPWRVEMIPQFRDGLVQWVTHPNALQDPAVVQNTLRATDGIVGDVGFIDSSNNTFRVLFNSMDPMATGCLFQCNSITSFDNGEHTTHKLTIDVSKLFSLSFWRSATPPAEITPDPYAAVDEKTIDGLTQRLLNLGMQTLQDWTEEYADDIISSYPDVTRDGLYLVTKSVAKTSPQTTPQQTMTAGLHVYTENLPAHMR